MVTGAGLPSTHQPQGGSLLLASSPVPKAVASESRVCNSSCVSPGASVTAGLGGWWVGGFSWKIHKAGVR